MKTRKYQLLFCICLLSFAGKAQLNPLIIGKIPANDSIVIVYEVTINSNLPAGTTHIQSQGSIAGSNFAGLVTDDPKTAALNDPTKTLLNSFPLPVTFIHFKAYEQNSSVRLEWKIAQQVNVRHYDVERSADGLSFTRIGQVMAKDNKVVYTFDDGQPLSGNGYYRIRSVDLDGKYQYTNILKLSNNARPYVNVFPNPVVNKKLVLQLANLKKGGYILELYNQAGQNIYRKTLSYAGGSMTEQVSLPAQIKGAGLVLLRNESGIALKQLVIIE